MIKTVLKYAATAIIGCGVGAVVAHLITKKSYSKRLQDVIAEMQKYKADLDQAMINAEQMDEDYEQAVKEVLSIVHTYQGFDDPEGTVYSPSELDSDTEYRLVEYEDEDGESHVKYVPITDDDEEEPLKDPEDSSHIVDITEADFLDPNNSFQKRVFYYYIEENVLIDIDGESMEWDIVGYSSIYKARETQDHSIWVRNMDLGIDIQLIILKNMRHYGDMTLFYYVGDDVLVNDDEEIMDHSIVGEKNLQHMKQFDIKVMYITNPTLELEIELVAVWTVFDDSGIGDFPGSDDDGGEDYGG